MKLLQLFASGTGHLRRLAARGLFPDGGDFRARTGRILADGYGGGHLLAPHLAAHGFDARVVIADSPDLQRKWAEEEGVPFPEGEDWIRRMARLQIERLRPDVIWCTNPSLFPGAFFRSLSHAPRLAVAHLSPGAAAAADLAGFDCIVSGSPADLDAAARGGARRVERLLPGFAAEAAGSPPPAPKAWDCLHAGRWERSQAGWNALLQALAKAPLQRKDEFRIGYFLAAEDPDALPAGTAMLDRGERWGRELWDALRAAKLALLPPGGSPDCRPGAMGIFDITGTGTFLLAHQDAGADGLFAAGREMETFRDAGELIEKVAHFSSRDSEREAMADRARGKCLAEHTLAHRAAEAADIIRRGMGAAAPAPARSTQNLKFLQIHHFYEPYLAKLYGGRPALQQASFREQMEAIRLDAFAAGHTLGFYMGQCGYESGMVVSNCPQAQARWMVENGVTLDNPGNWMLEITAKQIETLKPDILHLTHPILMDSRFIRALRWRPRLILGWRAASIPPTTDFTEFDIMLSSARGCREEALRRGARSVRHFLPGIPAFVAKEVGGVAKRWDVVFTGQWTPEHRQRNAYLARLAGMSAGPAGFDLGAFILDSGPGGLPPLLERLNRGAVWGMEMFRTLREGRIVFNASIDLAEGEAWNMRLFEAAGAGSFQLVGHHPRLGEVLEPGREVETYASEAELEEKIRHFLAHPEEREAIAARGQERCLREHSAEARARELDGIIRESLSGRARGAAKELHREEIPLYPGTGVPAQSRPAPKGNPMPSEQDLLQEILQMLQQNRAAEALAAIERSHPGERYRNSFDYAKAMVFCTMGRQREGAAMLTQLVAREPDFLDAGKLLRQLQSEGWTAVEPLRPAAPASPDYYGKARVNPSTLAAVATSQETWNEILAFHASLATDPYVSYVDGFYREGIRRFGRQWHYLDAVNVLYAAAKAVRPARYLEIGVRRGRSVCAVAHGCPEVDIYAFDMWIANYAGMDNPGPDFVREELRRHGHRGRAEFINGDSHTTLPKFFREHPGLELDLITVDGDHTEAGAAQDLADVIPHLAAGGVLVMDDIAHPAHPYLLKVWREAVGRHAGLVTHEFAEQGYGVAFAIKKA